MQHNTETIKMPKSSSDILMYNTLVYSALAEIPSVFISALISSIPFLGRVRSIAIGLLLSSVFAILSAFYLNQIDIFASLFKFSINIPFDIIYVYVCEAFPTKIRSIAIGVTNSFTRIGGIFTPIITQLLFQADKMYPIITFGVMSFIGIIVALFLPIETLGRKLV